MATEYGATEDERAIERMAEHLRIFHYYAMSSRDVVEAEMYALQELHRTLHAQGTGASPHPYRESY